MAEDETNGIVWLNGSLTDYSNARISFEDRGFYFGDGVYEVVRAYGGIPFALDKHLARLERSAAGIELPIPRSSTELSDLITQLIRQSCISDAEVYIQLTRGAARRNHLFPANVEPTLAVGVRGVRTVPRGLWESGCALISLADQRWSRCDLKTICLLPNVLAKQAASRAGAFDSVLVRDGFVTEGTASNVFIWDSGQLHTPIADNRILPGITRGTVIDLAGKTGVPVVERDLTLPEVLSAVEVFITSTTIELMPVVSVDGHQIGTGQPGDTWRALYSAFRQALLPEINQA
jgi:D-alanine transaminase